MTFDQLWKILIKRWKLVVICFLFVGIGSFIGSKLMKPLYQSTAFVQIVISSADNNQASYDSLLASEQLVETEATLATSDPVLREVASRYPGLSVTQLSDEVTGWPKTGTQLVEIDIVDPSPDRAASLANDIAATLIKQQLGSIQQNNAHAQQQIQQKIDQTQQQINNTMTEISALQAQGGEQRQLVVLQSQLSGLQQKYNQWQSDLAQVELTQVQGSTLMQVAQVARPTTSPVRPNVTLNTAGGLLVGLLLGVLLALFYDRLDTRVRTPEALIQLLRWPILATIWRTDSLNPNDVINAGGDNVNAEAFRILRTNIGFSNLDKPLRSMIVTSALTGDGKSVIAANLAIFMAMSGKSTLLIDADLRSPTQHILFNLSPNKQGLSNAVLAFSMSSAPNTPPLHLFGANPSTPRPQSEPSTTDLSLEPFAHSGGIPNLWVIPSGPLPPNPSELLESKAMQRLLAVIANCGIEVVIFDTPSLLAWSDANILASKVDGALIVVDTTRATKGKLKQMKAVLLQTGVHVIGCVANKLQHRGNDSTYYYYTEDLDGGEKSTRNGHISSSMPVTPILTESSSDQGSVQTNIVLEGNVKHGTTRIAMKKPRGQ